MPDRQQFPEHVVVRSFAGAGAEEDNRVVRLNAFEREVAGDAIADLQPVPFPQHEKPGRQSGRVRRVSGFAH